MDGMTVLTGVIAASTIAAAIASWLTWKVYRRLEHLQAEAVKVSAEMVSEAKRNREAQFAPLIEPRTAGGHSTRDSKGRDVFQHKYHLYNHGPGIAFDVVVVWSGTEILRTPSIAPNQSNEGHALCPMPSTRDTPPLNMEVRYADRFGGLFVSVMEKSRFVRYHPPERSES